MAPGWEWVLASSLRQSLERRANGALVNLLWGSTDRFLSTLGFSFCILGHILNSCSPRNQKIAHLRVHHHVMRRANVVEDVMVGIVGIRANYIVILAAIVTTAGGTLSGRVERLGLWPSGKRFIQAIAKGCGLLRLLGWAGIWFALCLVNEHREGNRSFSRLAWVAIGDPPKLSTVTLGNPA